MINIEKCLKDNKKAEYSKILITEALYTLAKKKPIQEISITEIAETAGVSRLTFYRNFDCKESVIYAHTDRIRRDFYGKIFEMNQPPDLVSVLNRSFSIWEPNREACIPVYRDALLYNVFHRSWDLSLVETSMLSHLTYTRQKIIIGGMYSILIDWLEEKNKCDKNDAIDAIVEIMLGKEKAKEAKERAMIQQFRPFLSRPQ